MKNKFIYLFINCFLGLQLLPAQGFDKIQLTKCAELAKDSLEFYAGQSDAARKKLEKQLGKLKYDRATYFGENDIYFKKGMSAYFKENKNMFSLESQSDKNIPAFLDTFKDLYQADRNETRWEYLQSFFEKEAAKPKSNLPKEAMAHRGMLPAEFSNQLKFDHLTKWTQQKLIAYALAGYKGLGGVQFGPKVTRKNDFELDNKYRTHIPYDLDESAFSAEWIAATYPMDGQYNFYLKEWLPGVGYFLFNRMPHSLLKQEGYKAMVRWTDDEGSAILSEPSIESFSNRIDFTIPSDLLKRERLYKLELVMMKLVNGKLEVLAADAKSDEDYFRENFPAMDAGQLRTEQVLHTIYFRTSKWDSYFAKSKTIQFAMDKPHFRGTAVVDEPLDDWELFGRDKLPPTISFRLLPDRPEYAEGIGSREMAYYLTFPEIEPVDTNDWTTPLQFEKAAEKENEQWRKKRIEKMIKTPVEWVYGSNRGERNTKGNGEENVLFDNGHTLYVLPEKIPFKLEQNVRTGFITKELYEKGEAPGFNGAQLLLELSGPEMISKTAILAKAEILKRKEDRARFFYLVNVREKKKTNETETRNLQDFLELDNNYMSGQVKAILNKEDLSPHNINGQILTDSKTMPGVSQRCSDSKIDLFPK